MDNSQATMIIDGRSYPINGEKTVIQLARNNGIDIPSLCYHPSLSTFGACRMCLVECEGLGIISSCTLAPRDGMVVRTKTETLRRMKKTTLQLLLADHDNECTTCPKSGHCRLQELARRFAVNRNPYHQLMERKPIDASSPSLVRDSGKCVLCGNCVRACTEFQGIGVLGFTGRGQTAEVKPAFNHPLAEVDCVNCGQCAAVCPVGAIVSHSYNDEIWAAINDPDTIVVAQIAPAVRVALGEEFGLKPGTNVMGKMVAAMRKIGFDAVYDTAFCAEITTVEEATEIIGRIQNGGKLPVFTSCCPAWVKYAEQYEHDMLDNLSSCKSPQEMGAAVIRKVLPQTSFPNVEQKNLVVVSVMPCTAKKFEIEREEFSHDGIKDINFCMTTIELGAMIREAGIETLDDIAEVACDDPFGLEPGSGVIFGVTGGVTEAVLRYAAEKRATSNSTTYVALKAFAKPLSPSLALRSISAKCMDLPTRKKSAKTSVLAKNSTTSSKSWRVPTVVSTAVVNPSRSTPIKSFRYALLASMHTTPNSKSAPRKTTQHLPISMLNISVNPTAKRVITSYTRTT